MTTNPKPKAKTERLIVEELYGETLVYDMSRHTASCLTELGVTKRFVQNRTLSGQSEISPAVTISLRFAVLRQWIGQR